MSLDNSKLYLGWDAKPLPDGGLAAGPGLGPTGDDGLAGLEAEGDELPGLDAEGDELPGLLPEGPDDP